MSKKIKTQYAPVDSFTTAEELQAEMDAHGNQHTRLILRWARMVAADHLRAALQERTPDLVEQVTPERLDKFAYAAFHVFAGSRGSQLFTGTIMSGIVTLPSLIVTGVLMKPEFFSAEAAVQHWQEQEAAASWKARLTPGVLLDIGYLCLLDAVNGVENPEDELYRNMTLVFEARGIMPSREEMQETIAQHMTEQDTPDEDIPEEIRVLSEKIKRSIVESVGNVVTQMGGKMKVEVHTVRLDD